MAISKTAGRITCVKNSWRLPKTDDSIDWSLFFVVTFEFWSLKCFVLFVENFKTQQYYQKLLKKLNFCNMASYGKWLNLSLKK